MVEAFLILLSKLKLKPCVEIPVEIPPDTYYSMKLKYFYLVHNILCIFPSIRCNFIKVGSKTEKFQEITPLII